MIYFLILALLLALIFHYDYQRHNAGRKLAYLSVLAIFILVSGLRYRIGIDSIVYEYAYKELPSLSQLSTFDYSTTRFSIGYIFLNSIARSISDDFVALQIIHAIFVNTIIFYFFYRNSKHIFTGILFYYIFLYTNYNFEILRESCAISVFLLAWPFCVKRKWFKYYLISFIAILFHPSAAITLIVPLIFLPGIRRFFQINLLTPFVIIGLFIIGQIIAVKFFDWIRLMDIASMDSYANTYENSHYAEGKNLNIIGMIAFFISTLFYPLFLGWLIKTRKIKASIPHFNMVMGMVLLLVYISTLKLNLYILYRFSNYFYPFLIVFLSDVIFSTLDIFKRKLKLSFGIWILFFLPIITISLTQYKEDTEVAGIKKYSRYYPYDTVIFKDTDAKRETLFSQVNYAM
ncbi:MAG: EpsG family protein [Bacteroidales bacterium]|nr:EpsG family protein [Bacteroidales bacterium]